MITPVTLQLWKVAQGQGPSNPLGTPMMATLGAGAPLGEVTSQGDTFQMGTASGTQPLGMLTPKRMPMMRPQSPLNQPMPGLKPPVSVL